jgi:hypothetical protein
MYLLIIGAYLAAILLLCVRLWRAMNSTASQSNGSNWPTDWMSTLVICAYFGFWIWRDIVRGQGHIGAYHLFLLPVCAISIWKMVLDVRRQRPRFTLSELFMLTTALAAYFAIARLFEPGSQELSMFTIVALVTFMQARRWQLKRRRQRADPEPEPSTSV